MVEASITYTTPTTTIHKFQDSVLGKSLTFQIIKLEGSLVIYINKTLDPCCNNLYMAAVSKYSDTPNSTILMGGTAEHPGNSIACRMSKKLKKIVYISLNVDEVKFLVPAIEKRLLQEINGLPEKF